VTQVEERLSELMQSAAPPLPEVALVDVAHWVRHRRTVAWSTAGVVAAAAAVTAIAFVSTTSGDSSPAPVVNHSLHGAVPWIDHPAPPYQPLPTPRTAPPATDARLCTAGDVAARFLPRGDGATGHMLIQLRFENTSGTTCVLKGYPTEVVASEPGLRDVTAKAGSYFPNQPTANIAPGESAFLGLETDSECASRPGGGPAGPPYHHVHVSLPGGGTVRVTRHSPAFDLTCGLQMTKFYVPQPAAPEPHDPLGDLQASLRLSHTARVGTTLEYGVALTNPTSTAISLDRCPGYDEAPVEAIAPGDTVLFAMQVPAPDQPGSYRLDWDLSVPSLHGVRPLHNPGGPAVWGSVKVVR
jgi:hypothetical protein